MVRVGFAHLFHRLLVARGGAKVLDKCFVLGTGDGNGYGFLRFAREYHPVNQFQRVQALFARRDKRLVIEIALAKFCVMIA